MPDSRSLRARLAPVGLVCALLAGAASTASADTGAQLTKANDRLAQLERQIASARAQAITQQAALRRSLASLSSDETSYQGVQSTLMNLRDRLAAAQAQSRLKTELKKFLAPTVLVCDELGYLPIDKIGADLLFQIISGRYEKGSTIITTNQIYKYWSRIFNNDATITSAVLDRLLHHAETVIVEGKSYRMKDKIEEP